MGLTDENKTEEPISQEDYEKAVITKAIEEWTSGTGNGNGIYGVVPDIPKGIEFRYVPILILIIILAALLISLLVILLFGGKLWGL
jgi:hypothetical protein